jgi:D-glycero-D-manno-heptose 1,7-bisphosphate phosphatase
VLIKKAVFLDRDGVINKKMTEGDYVKKWNDFFFLPGVFEAMEILKNKEILSIIITNQSCIARGIISQKQLYEIHDKMQREIQIHNGNIDAIYFCPHVISDGCNCRKPKTGMILKAIEEFEKKGININLSESYMIGDSENDVLTGQAAGVMTIKIKNSFESSRPRPITNLLEAVKSIF